TRGAGTGAGDRRGRRQDRPSRLCAQPHPLPRGAAAVPRSCLALGHLAVLRAGIERGSLSQPERRGVRTGLYGCERRRGERNHSYTKLLRLAFRRLSRCPDATTPESFMTMMVVRPSFG